MFLKLVTVCPRWHQTPRHLRTDQVGQSVGGDDEICTTDFVRTDCSSRDSHKLSFKTRVLKQPQALLNRCVGAVNSADENDRIRIGWRMAMDMLQRTSVTR